MLGTEMSCSSRAVSHRARMSLRHWPEVALAIGVLSLSPVRAALTQPQQLWGAGVTGCRKAVGGVATVFRDNLQGPMERIAAAVFNKPTVPLGSSAEESQVVLKQMIDSFNSEVSRNTKGAGMKGVMQAYEEEIRTPIRSALNGKLLRAGLIQVQEMKVNFETEMATVQRLLEAQQLNLQVLAMLPAVALSYAVYQAVSFVAMVPFSSDPLRPQLDIESLLHSIGRQVIAERTAVELSAAAYRARGARCLLSWQAAQVLKAKRVGTILGTSREAHQLRSDVSKLASTEMSAQHIPLLLEVVFRQLRR